jgi:hypothetical protein
MTSFIFVEDKYLQHNNILLKRLAPYNVAGNSMTFVSNYVLNRLCSEHKLIGQMVEYADKMEETNHDASFDSLIHEMRKYI